MKEIEIRTIDDIVNKVPEDRLEFFIKDLKSYLKIRYSGKDIINLLPKWSMEMTLKWIDDWKSDFKWINIKLK